VKASVYLTAMALAAGGLYLLAAGCALYPSQLAASIQPAVALREE
jgi:putative ABC transport system permease protein